jgi:hypothetical protein
MLDIGIQLTLTDNFDVRASLQNCNDWQANFQKKASFSRVNSSNGRSTIFSAALAESDIGS